MTLRTLNYGNYGIFLIMGHAGFCPSTVVEGSWGNFASSLGMVFLASACRVWRSRVLGVYIMYVCMHACMHVCGYNDIHMYVCMYVCIYIYI